LISATGCLASTNLGSTPWVAMAGPSVGNLWVVGSGGRLAHLLSDGGWALVAHDGGTADFVAASSFGQDVVAVSNKPDGDSVLRVLRADGSTDVLFSALPLLVNEVAQAPSGQLWLVGDPDNGATERILTLKLDGGLGTRTLTSDTFPFGAALGVAPVSDDEAWVSDDSGYLWHVEANGWTQVETGTRRPARGLVLSTTADGRRSLWLLGDFGMIIHRPL
jgi:hypothetical protein